MACTVAGQGMPCLVGVTWWSSGLPPILVCSLAPGTRTMIATYKEAAPKRIKEAGGTTGETPESSSPSIGPAVFFSRL